MEKGEECLGEGTDPQMVRSLQLVSLQQLQCQERSKVVQTTILQFCRNSRKYVQEE